MSEILVTCLRCGRVSAGLSRESAERAAREFVEYWKATPKAKDTWENVTYENSIAQYKCCGSTEFRKAKDGDCPNGVTIGGVICDLENLE